MVKPRHRSSPSPEMITHTPRYQSIAHNLKTLPTELVHKVLDDLPVIKILELITHNIPYIDSCILSHLRLREVFESPESLSTVKEYFIVYVELRKRRHSRGSDDNPSIPLLAHGNLTFLKHEAPRYRYRASPYELVLAEIKTALLLLLNKYASYVPVLSKFAPAPIPGRALWDAALSHPKTLRSLWDNIDAAERNICSIKTEQQRRIAKLLLEYPGMLRTYKDVSQEPRIHSLQHLVNTYETAARKTLELKKILGGNGYFGEHKFPLVPYDRYLKCFLRVLERFPLAKSTAPSDGSKSPRPRQHTYSSEAATNISKAVQGMGFVYLRTSLEEFSYPPIPRTRYTLYSEKGYRSTGGQQQPKFLDRSLSDPYFKASHIESENDRVLPVEEKEFEWLEAFLKSCRFMEQMDDVQWSPKLTVQQFWCIHTCDRTAPPIRTVN